MDNSDERDYAEEEYNRRLMEEVDDLDNLGTYRTMDESEQEVEDRLPVGYGDEWDGSARNQSNHFFIGHAGYVTVLWHITNNPFEKYDSSVSYQTPARDGSTLYVWCYLKQTDDDAFRYIDDVSEALFKMDGSRSITNAIS